MVPTRLAGLALLLLLLPACPHKYKRTYSEPGAEEILDSLAARRAAVKSFQTESQMDYWVGNDRFRGTVLILGELGAKVRINALRPDEDVAVDLACNGADFVMVDKLKNCVLTGPCNQDSIAQLLRVPLAPDDFLYLALGTTPVIPGATATVSWDAKRGAEVVKLSGAGGMTQTIIVDGRDGKKTWDLLHSEIRAGKDVVWMVDHKDYSTKAAADGASVRVPGKSNFKTPTEKSDLLVEWIADKRQVNLTIDPTLFVLEPPPVAMCGASARP
jgi:outer membrane lipoprotein-sorting protein